MTPEEEEYREVHDRFLALSRTLDFTRDYQKVEMDRFKERQKKDVCVLIALLDELEEKSEALKVRIDAAEEGKKVCNEGTAAWAEIEKFNATAAAKAASPTPKAAAGWDSAQ